MVNAELFAIKVTHVLSIGAFGSLLYSHKTTSALIAVPIVVFTTLARFHLRRLGANGKEL